MMTRQREDVRLLKSAEEVWSQVQQILAKKLNVPKYMSFVAPAKLVELTESQATLAAPNDFTRDVLAADHAALIKETLFLVTQQRLDLRVIVDASLARDRYTASVASIAVAAPMGEGDDAEKLPAREPQPALGASFNGNAVSRSNLNTKYTFDSFVVGSHNRFCYSAAQAIVQKPAEAYNPLFVYGGVGLGKTHLMQAIGHEVLLMWPNKVVRYMTCERFTNELINSIRENRMVDFRKRYRQVDVLLMDDIQFIAGKESTQEEFFHTFNTLRENGSQIVLSSDRAPKAISLLEERLRSRFEWGLIADMSPPDLETRVAILHKKCQLENMRISDELIEMIASMFTTNIRELEGALIRANAYSSLTGTPLTAQTLRQLFQPETAAKAQKSLTIEAIIDAVAEHYRIEPSEIRSSKRSQDLTLPRHVAMYLAHELMNMSYPRIGQCFSNRKHTSALYAFTRIKEAIAEDLDLAESIKQITRRLSA
ncbi:MAG TPA: chromosomal replication initiator protein DnaA [Candidatus Obscuribacterales bacterium]